MQEQFTAIILAATEFGGMGGDYFEAKTRHLLPIADKPLIQHLVETVDEFGDRIKRRVIVIDEKVEENKRIKPCEETYEEIFGERVGKNGDIELAGQDPLTQVGTFEAVRRYVDNDKKGNIFPLLVLYGDTLYKAEFLNRVLQKYYSKQEPTRVIWGLIRPQGGYDNVHCVKQDYSKDPEGYFEISGKDIVDIFKYPQKCNLNDCLYLHDSGMLVISKDAWDNILKIIDRIHRPSPLGSFSFQHITKQALIFKDVSGIKDPSIEIIGIVAPKGQSDDADYPWELLELNGTKISDLVEEKKAKISDSVHEIVWTREEEEGKDKNKEKEIGKKTIYVPEEVKFVTSSGSRIKGPCILGKNIKICDYAIIEHSYIGDNCKIGEYAKINGSTLGKNITIYPHAVIEKSIIMESSEICYHAEVLYSVVGEGVLIGCDVKTPYQKLKKVDGEPEDQNVIYFSDVGIKRPKRFGAIVGDHCQIGCGNVIHPGRRIGTRSTINPNCEIVKNIKPRSKIKNKEIKEEYE